MSENTRAISIELQQQTSDLEIIRRIHAGLEEPHSVLRNQSRQWYLDTVARRRDDARGSRK
jgi:hypothetical protein